MTANRLQGIMMFLYAETPLHVGSGVGLGAVDLPIQRERMSGLPMVQGSGIKGALRDRLSPREREDLDKETADGEGVGHVDAKSGRLRRRTDIALFGPRGPGAKAKDERQSGSRAEGETEKVKPEKPENANPDDFAGAMSVADARLLLFPVRTVWGGWAWLTSPMILDRFQRDIEVLFPLQKPNQLAFGDKNKDTNTIWVPKGEAVYKQDRIIIEDFDYPAEPNEKVDKLAAWLAERILPTTDGYQPFKDRLARQLVVVSDTEMAFLARHATEVIARTSIDEKTGTVTSGALWSEENLPAETVLWTTAIFEDSRIEKEKFSYSGPEKANALKSTFVKAAEGLARIYLGGNRNVGRGLVGVRVWGGEP